jgi:DNA-binding CsgD family transcriptional regulator
MAPTRSVDVLVVGAGFAGLCAAIKLHEAAGVRVRHGVPPVDVVSEPDEHEEPSLARPSEGWESLTESELRVARLVAEGAKNREAAARLFLSPHTVSTHLRHCFAKLGINSRVELVRVALEYEPQRLS